MEDQKTSVRPSWFSEPFHVVLDRLHDIVNLTKLAVGGISAMCAYPQAIEVLDKYRRWKGELAPDEHMNVEVAGKLAELAGRMIDTGFSLLHEQALISLWGTLEAFVEDLLACWLLREPSAREAEPVRSVRVSITEFELMDQEQRCLYIIKALEQETSAIYRKGIGRFETLLDVFGLGGPVSATVRRDVHELQQVRNVLVHRRGIADRQLLEACPWMDVAIGDQVVVTSEDLLRYVRALDSYLAELIYRGAHRFDPTFEREPDGTAPNDEHSA